MERIKVEPFETAEHYFKSLPIYLQPYIKKMIKQLRKDGV